MTLTFPKISKYLKFTILPKFYREVVGNKRSIGQSERESPTITISHH